HPARVPVHRRLDVPAGTAEPQGTGHHGMGARARLPGAARPAAGPDGAAAEGSGGGAAGRRVHPNPRRPGLRGQVHREQERVRGRSGMTAPAAPPPAAPAAPPPAAPAAPQTPGPAAAAPAPETPAGGTPPAGETAAGFTVESGTGAPEATSRPGAGSVRHEFLHDATNLLVEGDVVGGDKHVFLIR